MARKSKRKLNQDSQSAQDRQQSRSVKLISFDEFKTVLSRLLVVNEKTTVDEIINREKIVPIKFVILTNYVKKLYTKLDKKLKEKKDYNPPIRNTYEYSDEYDNPRITIIYKDFEEDVLEEDKQEPKNKLEDSEWLELLKRLDNWYDKVNKATLNQEDRKPPMLGFVSSGGFLRGKNENELFVLSLQSGINSFIGNRGSGKSTALNLLSLLADSLSAESQDDDISEWIKPKRRDFHTYGTRKVGEFFKQKDIKEYACFFYERKNQENIRKLYAFYANTKKHYWHLFEQDENNWLSSSKALESIFPDVLVLSQGRLTSIIEKQHNLVINQILEGLNSALKNQQDELHKSFKSLAKQYKEINQATEQKHHQKSSNSQNSKNELKEDEGDEDVSEEDKQEPKNKNEQKVFSKVEIDDQAIDRFLENHWKDIEIFRNLSQSQNSSNIEEILNKLESYLNQYNQYRITLPQNSLLRLMKSGEQGLKCLYVGLISDFLQYKIQQIKVEDKEKQQTHLNDLLGIIENRLLIIAQLQENLKSCYFWRNALPEICNQSLAFFQKQSDLLENQKNFCEEITNKLASIKEQQIKFTFVDGVNKDNTNETKQQFQENQELKENLIKIKNLKCYEVLYTNLQNYNKSTPNQDLQICLEQLRIYNSSIFKLINILNKIEKTLSDKYSATQSIFVNFPVDINLKQGDSNIYRPFKQLSYGQKTGIILTILSIMNDAEMIIIDQPEDNLDNDAIATIFLPTLKEVSNKSISINIATHNSALVIGLRKLQHCVFAMKKPGEFGGIEHFGTTRDQKIVRLIFDILEQGYEQFKIKVEFFQESLQDLDLFGKQLISKLIAEVRNLIKSETDFKDWFSKVRNDVKNTLSNVGKYSDGIMHDINTVLNNSQESLEETEQQLLRIVDNYDAQVSNPVFDNIDVYSLLQEMIAHRKGDRIDYKLDTDLQNIKLRLDPNQIKIVFTNLFSNLTVAIEKVEKVKNSVEKYDYRGIIEIKLIKNEPSSVVIQLKDNGIGICPNCINKIYKERYTSKEPVPENHGIGCMTVKDLLEKNNAAIEIDFENTRHGCKNSQTVQIITFQKNNYNKGDNQ